MKTLQLIAAAVITLSPAYANAPQVELKLAATQDSSTMATDDDSDMQDQDNGDQNAESDQNDQNDQKFPTQDHQDAYNSLSEKNQKAYDGLEDHEQDQVTNTYKKGGDHQKTLSNILKKDQKQYSQTQQNGTTTPPSNTKVPNQDMSNTPATKSMKKQTDTKDDTQDENVFSD